MTFYTYFYNKNHLFKKKPFIFLSLPLLYSLSQKSSSFLIIFEVFKKKKQSTKLEVWDKSERNKSFVENLTLIFITFLRKRDQERGREREGEREVEEKMPRSKIYLVI